MATVPVLNVTEGVFRAAAQQENQLRVGVTLGGTSFLGLSAEYLWGRTALEATLGTFSLRDISLAVAGKQYIGGGSVRAFLGLGLWAISDFGAERTGLALLARAPLGVDWQVSGNHYTGLEMGLNRALLLRRTDPTDTTPPASRVVPLPALYYRFGEPR